MGENPFKVSGVSPIEIHRLVEMIQKEAFKKPSSALKELGRYKESKHLKGDVDCIVAKCLEKDRNQRYGSVLELQKDIENHLNEIPIAAQTSSLIYRMRNYL